MEWIALLTRSVGLVSTIASAVSELLEGRSYADKEETIKWIKNELKTLQENIDGLSAKEESEQAELDRLVPPEND